MSKNTGEIAIIGGGIAGLYCAYVLGKEGRKVHLFEATNRIGGRILTVRLMQGENERAANIEAIDPSSNEKFEKEGTKKLEFYAEFGPMRVELDKQILLRGLFKKLNITGDARNADEKAVPSLVEFPGYASPASVGDPTYELRQSEEGKTPLELMQLAMLRIMMEVKLSDSKKEAIYKERREKLIEKVQLAASTGGDVLERFTEWIKDLEPNDHVNIQFCGHIDGVPLYAQGFWNLLSDYLSHDAIMKISNLGTFYHLLPMNPSAAEWLTWWLINLSISDNLQGVHGGMAAIVSELRKQIADIGQDVVEIHTDFEASSIAFEKLPNESGVPTSTGQFVIEFKHKEPIGGFERVILALPKGPIKRLLQTSSEVFQKEKELPELLGSARAFPMSKVFVVVKKRWWGNETMANRFATRLPTRELHYWPAIRNDNYGMIMLYTDSPASSFWANYVPPGAQSSVSYKNCPQEDRLPLATENRLLDKIVQYINENNVPALKADDILWWGIRDWGRFPYGGANHMWRPERKYWQVMGRLGEIETLAGGRVHICGEAYSDYHGFIEGALRSATYTLHRVLEHHKQPKLAWLRKYRLLAADKAEEADNTDINYFESLLSWCETLDEAREVTGPRAFFYDGNPVDPASKGAM